MKDISFRPNASKGLWLPALLPAASLIISITLHDKNNSTVLALLSIQSCLYCYHLIYLVLKSCSDIKKDASQNKTSRSCTPRDSQRSNVSADAPSASDSSLSLSQTFDADTSGHNVKLQEDAPYEQKAASSPAIDFQKYSEENQAYQVKATLTTSILIWLLTGSNWWCSLVSVTILTISQAKLTQWLLLQHSSSFSAGEWLMAGQCISLTLACSAHGLMAPCPASLPYATCQMQAFLQLAVLISAGGLFIHMNYCCKAGSVLSLLSTLLLFIVLALAGMLSSSMFMGEFVVTWILNQMFGTIQNVLLIMWWLFWSIFTWLVTCIVFNNVSVSAVRKIFHLICVMIYTVGILCNPNLLKLATVAATIMACFFETLRIFHVSPVGDAINSIYGRFLDEKDKFGTLILSNIYLLLGLSIPLWMVTVPEPHPSTPIFTFFTRYSEADCTAESCDNAALFSVSHELPPSNSSALSDCSANVSTLALLAGVLAVGIGDTFASIGGLKYGRHRWPGSKKTMEGTAWSIASQIIAVAFLWITGCLHPNSGGLLWWSGVSTTIIVVSLVEAFTDQVDNLALPLLTFCGILITDWCSG